MYNNSILWVNVSEFDYRSQLVILQFYILPNCLVNSPATLNIWEYNCLLKKSCAVHRQYAFPMRNYLFFYSSIMKCSIYYSKIEFKL